MNFEGIFIKFLWNFYKNFYGIFKEFLWNFYGIQKKIKAIWIIEGFGV
jgi:hypothetical protein